MRTERRVFTGILLAALNLRIAIATVGPVVDEIRDDTGMSSALAGVLTALPFLCMGVFALFGPALIRGIGYARVLYLSLALIGLGSIARVGVVDSVVLLIGTLPIGVGVAFIGAAIPGLVRHYFSSRAGAVTGQYVASSSVGGALAAFLSVPLAAALGGWQWALMLTAVPALVALAVWPWAGVHQGDMPAAAPSPARLRPSRVGLTLGVAFGLESLCFSGVMAWVAPHYSKAGWSPEVAALASGVILLIVLPGSLLAPALSDGHDRRYWIAGAGALLVAGLFGMGALGTAAGWIWIALVGFGLGAMFTLMLALPVDLSRHALEATDLAAWMQGIGFSIAALGPVVVGAVRDLSGGFEMPFVLLAAIAMLSALITVVAVPPPRKSGGSDSTEADPLRGGASPAPLATPSTPRRS